MVGHSRKQQSREGRKREQQVGRAVGKDSSRRAFRESSRVAGAGEHVPGYREYKD